MSSAEAFGSFHRVVVSSKNKAATITKTIVLQLSYSRFFAYELTITKSVLRASFIIYHLTSNAYPTHACEIIVK